MEYKNDEFTNVENSEEQNGTEHEEKVVEEPVFEERNNEDFVSEYKSEYMSDTPEKHERNYFDEIPTYFHAGFTIRMVAYLIDVTMIEAFKSLFINRIVDFAGMGTFSTELINAAVLVLYFTLFTFFTNGQTLGKMITGLRVVEMSGERITLTTVIIREIFCRFVLYKIPILYLMIPFNRRKLHLGDMLTDTAVLYEKMLVEEIKVI